MPTSSLSTEKTSSYLLSSRDILSLYLLSVIRLTLSHSLPRTTFFSFSVCGRGLCVVEHSTSVAIANPMKLYSSMCMRGATIWSFFSTSDWYRWFVNGAVKTPSRFVLTSTHAVATSITNSLTPTALFPSLSHATIFTAFPVRAAIVVVSAALQ